MQHISLRLEKIAGLVDCNARVADIGADHGYLSIFLEKEKQTPQIIACDINEKPLSVARKNIEKMGCTKIELRLSDGFEKIKKNEIDTAVIAGMGGEVISGIIERCEWIKSDKYTLILQPMTSSQELRRYLYSNKFEIVAEAAVFDSDKLYTVIKAVYSGVSRPYRDGDCYIGKLSPENETDYKYLKKQLNIITDCCESLKGVLGKSEEYLYYKSIAKELKNFLGED